MADDLNRCTNCGADLSVLRVSACCNHPGRVVDFPMEFPPDPIEPLNAALTALQAKNRKLVEALKAAEEYLASVAIEGSEPFPLFRVRAAIAEAEKGEG